MLGFFFSLYPFSNKSWFKTVGIGNFWEKTEKHWEKLLRYTAQVQEDCQNMYFPTVVLFYFGTV